MGGAAEAVGVAEEVEAVPGPCAWQRGAQAPGLRAARLTRWCWIVVATCWMVAPQGSPDGSFIAHA